MIFDETKKADTFKIKSKKPKKVKLNKKREKKAKPPKVYDRAVSLLPFVDINSDVIELKKGVMDIYQIESRDIYSLNEDEAKRLIYEKTRFYRVFQSDFKFVSMNFPMNTGIQQQYLQRKIQTNQNPVYLPYLYKKVEELKFLEENRLNQEYYLFLFADSVAMLNDQKKTVKRMLQMALPLKEISEGKKEQILSKLNNQSSKIIYYDS